MFTIFAHTHSFTLNIYLHFCRYLKCVEPADADHKGLYSYVIKTTMLWICEQTTPDDPVWSDLERSVKMLLLKLMEALQNDTLHHYFIPNINLLVQTGKDVKRKCFKIIRNLNRNIFLAAPLDIDEKLEFVRWVGSSAEKCTMILAPNLEVGIPVREFLVGLLFEISRLRRLRRLRMLRRLRRLRRLFQTYLP